MGGLVYTRARSVPEGLAGGINEPFRLARPTLTEVG
jgi:hypothetical protein